MVTSTILYRQKNLQNNTKGKELGMIFYMNPNPPVYVLRTLHEHGFSTA